MRKKNKTKQNSLFLELRVLLAQTQSKCSVFESAWSARAWPLLRQVEMRERGRSWCWWRANKPCASPSLLLLLLQRSTADSRCSDDDDEEEEERRGEDGEGILQRTPHPSLLLALYYLFIHCKRGYGTCKKQKQLLISDAESQTKKLQDFCWWCRWAINRLLFLPLPFWPHFRFPLCFLRHSDDLGAAMVSDEWQAAEHNIPVSCGHKRGKLGQENDSGVNPPVHHGPAN